MSLNFTLQVNEYPIGVFDAVRIEGTTDPNSINKYRVRIYDRTHKLWEGITYHRYGDGAWRLVWQALCEFQGDCAENFERLVSDGSELVPRVPGELHPEGSEPLVITGSDAFGGPEPRG